MSYIVHKAVELSKVQKKHAPSKAYLAQHYIIQPKYDGVNCVAIVRAVQDAHQVELLTRTGEKIKSCEHIKLALSTFPGVIPGVYLGELWNQGLEHQVINGMARSHQPQPELQFVIFDYLTLDEWEAGESDVPYLDRTERLPEPLFRVEWGQNPLYLTYSEGTLEESGVTAEEAADKYVSCGTYDGIILRDPNGKWKRGNGTTGEIIKVKVILDETFEVVGHTPGEGKYDGMIGALVVRCPRTQNEYAVGTGLTDAQRTLPNRLLGAKVDVQFLGKTPDGRLREPRIKGVRFDVV